MQVQQVDSGEIWDTLANAGAIAPAASRAVSNP